MEIFPMEVFNNEITLHFHLVAMEMLVATKDQKEIQYRNKVPSICFEESLHSLVKHFLMRKRRSRVLSVWSELPVLQWVSLDLCHHHHRALQDGEKGWDLSIHCCHWVPPNPALPSPHPKLPMISVPLNCSTTDLPDEGRVSSGNHSCIHSTSGHLSWNSCQQHGLHTTVLEFTVVDCEICYYKPWTGLATFVHWFKSL